MFNTLLQIMKGRPAQPTRRARAYHPQQPVGSILTRPVQGVPKR